MERRRSGSIVRQRSCGRPGVRGPGDTRCEPEGPSALESHRFGRIRGFYEGLLFDLDGRVALVTGGAGRVGRIVCDALAAAGARVVVNGRTPATIEALAERLSAGGPAALAVRADVRREDEVRAMAAAIEARFGRLDVLVNNVTGNHPATLQDMTAAQWNKAMEGALATMFLCTKVFAPVIAASGGGSIVNVGSIYGRVSPDHRIYGDSGLDASPVYAAAKAGVRNFTRYVATRWAEAGVRCNTLTLGGLASSENEHEGFRAGYARRTPLGRMMEADDVRGPIVFLASDASSYVTGTDLVVDGGWTAW